MNEIGCPVCSVRMSVQIAHGRKSNKLFIMLKCPVDGRHFRGFISDQDYVAGVLSDVEAGRGTGGGGDVGDDQYTI